MIEAYEAKFGNLTILQYKCRLCGKDYALKVSTEDYTDYCNSGKLIQNCFPYLTDGERELMISGICDGCFDGLIEELEV